MGIPNPDNFRNVSDWVELYIACSDTKISKSELANYIQSETGKEVEEDFISNVWRELESRAGVYIESPFNVESRVVSRVMDWKNIPTYLTCLLFSVYGGTYELYRSAKIFERVASKALEKYYGFRTNIFGWPVDSDEP